MLRGPYKPQWKETGAPCEVCGKPRSSGLHFVDHGPCMEKLAAKAAEVKKRKGPAPCSDDDLRIAKYRRDGKNLERETVKFLRTL